jgi:hypothetical protein
MNLADDSERETWLRYLGEIVVGRKVIAGFGVLAGFVDDVERYRRLGAQKPMLVVNSRGAGPVPSDEDADIVYFARAEYASMTEEVRSHDTIARNLPAEVVGAVEAYDPDGEAVWFVDPFVENTPILGRQVYGGRPATWTALEDKLVAEEVWDAIDAPHASSLVVDVDLPALREAASRLDLGHGTVWTGDARDGMNGGGDYVRWVVTEEEQGAAFAFFALHCDRVRVMPFLEGVPCSIHGIVLPDGVAALRPVELAMLRIPAARQFVYGGLGTTWNPPATDRADMQDLVRRTGEHLRQRADYRGFFGIDGVLTRDGFRPTEINTRMSGGAATLARALDGDALSLLQANLVAGRDPRVSAAEIEAWALPVLDANPIGKPIAVSGKQVAEESLDLAVVWDGERLRPARADDRDSLDMIVGPTGSGTFAKITSEHAVARGERLAPINVALMRFLDEELGTDFGPVEVAPDVR